ncbi:hypothetical protein ASG73_12340 [Janibacter sp. Soil728]|uniref:hypothetical protein n=1 Tax=Janibacter sp. Soil728 TaxID=1736393 RepID=UPI0006F982C5|nr:hypothetical protein [Janibacter sp. Soil728]KRE37084.1 hypothetical protein ASG73_12340 [Janibacter sp. Soil728]
MKQRVSIYKHGEDVLIGVNTFFASHPGSTDTTICELLHAPDDETLGGTVLRLLDQSGILDLALIAKGSPGRSYAAATLGLPSDTVLTTEAVCVDVTRRGQRLILEPSISDGAGGGFEGGLEPVVVDEPAEAGVVGHVVRECATRAQEASAGVLRPAGSWRGQQAGAGSIPSEGVVTARRAHSGWSVTARIDARGGGQSGVASSSVGYVAREGSLTRLGQVVVEVLDQAHGRDLQPGDEDPAGGERQVLVEADESGLTIYPQAISVDTGVWDFPAHQDVRTLPRQASLADIGQAVSLAAEEAADW